MTGISYDFRDLRVSDIKKIRDLVKSKQESEVISTFCKQLKKLRDPSELDLNDTYKAVQQLNSTGLWDVLDLKKTMNTVKKHLDDKVFSLLEKVLGVTADSSDSAVDANLDKELEEA